MIDSLERQLWRQLEARYRRQRQLTFHHPWRVMEHHSGAVNIDVMIAPLIGQLWYLGMDSKFCCQGGVFRTGYISFVKPEALARFVRLIRMPIIPHTELTAKAVVEPNAVSVYARRNDSRWGSAWCVYFSAINVPYFTRVMFEQKVVMPL